MRQLALILLLAQEGLPGVPPRMPVDEEPSAAACTFAVALRGEPCAYEASTAPGDPLDNAAVASDAGRQACASAAMADSQGHLTRDAQECAEVLRQEISRTARAATLSPACCACLAESRCSVGAAQCKRELADLAPSAALRSCLSRSCSDSCSFAAPARPAPEESPAPAPEDPRHPKKI